MLGGCENSKEARLAGEQEKESQGPDHERPHVKDFRC